MKKCVMKSKKYEELAKQLRDQTGISVNFLKLNDLKYFEQSYEYMESNGKFDISHMDGEQADITKQQYLEVLDYMIYMLTEIKVALRKFEPLEQEQEDVDDWREAELNNKMKLISKYSGGKFLISELGGRIKGFWFSLGETGTSLVFGYGNGVLGYDLLNDSNRDVITNKDIGCPDSTAKEEYELILKTLTYHGFGFPV